MRSMWLSADIAWSAIRPSPAAENYERAYHMPRQRWRFNCVLAAAPTFPYNAHTKGMTN